MRESHAKCVRLGVSATWIWKCHGKVLFTAYTASQSNLLPDHLVYWQSPNASDIALTQFLKVKYSPTKSWHKIGVIWQVMNNSIKIHDLTIWSSIPLRKYRWKRVENSFDCKIHLSFDWYRGNDFRKVVWDESVKFDSSMSVSSSVDTPKFAISPWNIQRQLIIQHEQSSSDDPTVINLH